MTIKKWTVETARACIERNGGKVATERPLTTRDVIEIIWKKETKTIQHSSPGLTVLGAIDFLVNHAGYHWRKE